MRFVAAEVGGKKVKQLVQQPFTFTLPGVEPKAGSQREVAVREGKRLASVVDKDQSAGVWEEKQSPPRILYRVENGTTEVVNFELLNSKGGVVSSYASDKLPTEIRADDIAAMEVIKPRSCAATNSSSCPLIRITLKEGREAAYRKR
jgi:hypothetical protein